MKKFHLEFSDSASQKLDKIAESRHASKTEVVRHALDVYSFIEEAIRNGGKFFVEFSNGEKNQVIIP